MAGSIDLHAHFTPRGLRSGNEWFGAHYERAADGESQLVVRDRRYGRDPEKMLLGIEARLADMDAVGTDVQVLSVSPLLFDPERDTEAAVGAARDVNDEIAEHVRAWPARFRGLAMLPLPDVAASVAELERAVGVLGLDGAEVDTHVAGLAWDEPVFEPLLAAAEELGAVLFFHPSNSLIWRLTGRYHLGNSVGNPIEDILAVSALISGGVFDRHPNLKVVIAHGGGPIPFGIGRIDRGWLVRPEARDHILQPPSRYLRNLYYDCITWSEPSLRFLVDTVGTDRVVLGSDWPYDMGIEAPARWLRAMPSLTESEKELILHGNAERLLRLPVPT